MSKFQDELAYFHITKSFESTYGDHFQNILLFGAFYHDFIKKVTCLTHLMITFTGKVLVLVLKTEQSLIAFTIVLTSIDFIMFSGELFV